MADNKFGTKHSTADDRFETSKLTQKGKPQSKLSDAAAKKVADVLHIMLNEKG